MEEDLKILEKYIEKDIPCDSCRYCGERPNVSKAVRNLIAKNKELDEENTRQHELLGRIHEKYQQDYISKSKVKEKIEEINKEGIWITEDYYFNETLQDEYPICKKEFTKEELEEVIIDILQKLIED